MKLYNTMSRTIEEFTPMSGQKVTMYTCGLTVYSAPQIGNWVAYIYSDVLTRILIASGYDVTRVQNITDVGHLVSDDDAGEDKMQKGAKAEGKSAWEIADKYIGLAEDEGYQQLGLLRPNKLVRATDLIPEQIEFVQGLEAKGFTYTIPDEGVYFDTSKLTDYGKLARLDIKGLKAGARVDVTGKRNITDFALWKFSPSNEKRDMEWGSPWGTGFPGWHLECSVIARENLGDQIDIHTGGIDHIPVHHTNEIAQTESLTGKTFVNYWFHNNFMKIDGTKLSKSLGNSYTLSDIQQKGFSLDAFRLLVLSSHYRTEGNFSWDILQAAQNRLNNWREAVDLRWQDFAPKDDKDKGHGVMRADLFNERLLASLQNDLDTPKALALIDTVLGEATAKGLCKPCLDSIARDINEFLGIDLLEGKSDISTEQKQLIQDRQAARDSKDWELSDKLRDQLQEQGILVRDTPDSTIWSRI